MFTDGNTATGDVLVGADGANSLVRQQYLPEAPRLDTDAVSIAGRLPLNPQTLAVFTSAFTGRQRMSEAIWRGQDLAAAGLDPQLLLYDVSGYLLWAFIAHRKHYPANSSALDGRDLKLIVDRMIRDWHPTLARPHRRGHRPDHRRTPPVQAVNERLRLDRDASDTHRRLGAQHATGDGARREHRAAGRGRTVRNADCGAPRRSRPGYGDRRVRGKDALVRLRRGA